MNNSEKRHLIDKIRDAQGLTEKEKTDLINFLNESKTYGLVWENKVEDIEEKLREELPVLWERDDDKIKPIISEDPNAPNHIIIEGDNLAALTDLSYTHAGKIDVIYIDPPYNTGNKDFTYNDDYVDKDDAFRHSKWLSFMNRRLRIAKTLLSEKGIFFISIDDNEQANLKLLCDEVFGYDNFISCISWQANPGGNKSDYVETTLQYILVYCNNKLYVEDLGYYEEIDASKYPLQDNIGYYKKGAQLEKWGNDDTIHTHPNLAYSIYYSPTCHDTKVLFDYNQKELNDNRSLPIVYNVPDKELLKQGYVCIRPRVTNVGEGGRWRLEPKTFFERLSKNSFIFEKQPQGYRIYEKDRCKSTKFIKAKDFISSEVSKQSSADIIEIFGSKIFNYPKPISLLNYLLSIGSYTNSIILDFFAGSGTTLHATMQLNKEDGGKRTCILCTNNENNICEDVTYERNKRVINGYIKPNEEKVEGLKDNNLRYYRTEFVSRERTNKNRRELMYKSTPLLNIKEDLYTEMSKFGKIKLNPKGARYFEDDKKKMLVIYRPEFISYFVEEIDKMEIEKPILVYVYSPGKYAFDDEFEIVAEKVQLCALPQAIIDAMSRVLPDQKEEELIPETEIKITDGVEEIDLFANLKED